MDSAQAKRIALFASIGAGAVTTIGQLYDQHAPHDSDLPFWQQVGKGMKPKVPVLTVIVATFGLAVITTAVAEVAPKPAALISLTIFATSAFAVSDSPMHAISNLAAARPPAT